MAADSSSLTALNTSFDTELIEFGQGYKSMGYDFPHNGLRYMEPRPFTKKTIENLKSNKAHVEAMKNGLKKRGLNIK